MQCLFERAASHPSHPKTKKKIHNSNNPKDVPGPRDFSAISTPQSTILLRDFSAISVSCISTPQIVSCSMCLSCCNQRAMSVVCFVSCELVFFSFVSVSLQVYVHADYNHVCIKAYFWKTNLHCGIIIVSLTRGLRLTLN